MEEHARKLEKVYARLSIEVPGLPASPGSAGGVTAPALEYLIFEKSMKKDQAKYKKTEKGKETEKRYNKSDAKKEANRRYRNNKEFKHLAHQ